MRLLLVVLLLVLVSFPVGAVPAGEGSKQKARQAAARGPKFIGQYLHRHTVRIRHDENDEREAKVADLLYLWRLADGSVQFSLFVAAVNGHECSLDGVALPKGSFLEHTHRLDDVFREPDPCVVRITFNDSVATVDDLRSPCHREACGARASIGKIRFVRNWKARAPRPPVQ